MHRKAVQSKHVHPPKPIIHEIHPKHRIFIHQGWRSEGWVGSGETEARPKPNPSPYAAPMEFGSDSHTLNPDPHTHTPFHSTSTSTCTTSSVDARVRPHSCAFIHSPFFFHHCPCIPSLPCKNFLLRFCLDRWHSLWELAGAGLYPLD